MRRIIVGILAISTVSLGVVAAQAQEASANLQPAAYHLQEGRAFRSMDLTSSPYVNRDPNCSVWGHRIWPCE